MLLFLYRWDYCWKYEFDTDVKIKKYYHQDGEHLVFYKKVHIKTESKRKDVLFIFILLQERNNSNLFDKNCTEENVKFYIRHEESWVDESQLIRQITSNTTSRWYFMKEIVFVHFQSLFGRSNRNAFLVNADKIHEGRCVKEFFSQTCRLAFSQRHYRLTFSQIVFKDFK